MGKFKVRGGKGSKKKQRWEKGGSSSSNPSKTKHRDAARSKMLRMGFGIDSSTGQASEKNATPSRLTAEHLLRHEALLGQAQIQKDGDNDAGSESGLTTGSSVKTFASEYSQCTNISFDKLTQRFSSNNAHHREMLAILAAITQVIKSKGGEESSTEYFAALLTTLEATTTAETISAVVTLISMVIKSVPVPVLQKQFDPVAKILMELLSRQDESSEVSVSLIKSLIGCLSVTLRAQQYETWQSQSTIRVFDSILRFATHSKPRIRKASHHAAQVILKGSRFLEDADVLHPGAAPAAKFCIKSIEDNLGGSNVNAVLHSMLLLKDIISVFPKNQIKPSCETVLKIMASGEPRALTCGFQVLYGLFSGRPTVQCLPPELNVQIISALYDYMPSINDAQPVVAWLTVQQEAHANLSIQNPKLCVVHLPKFFSTTARCWTSDKPSICAAATTAMKALCIECLKPNLESIFKGEEEKAAIKKVFHSIEEGLNYQYRLVWPQVFHLLATFIDVTGSENQPYIGNCLQSLADLRGSMNFSLTNELDHVVGKAIKRMGPQKVLEAIPLNITGKEISLEFPRSWLLPIMRENVSNTEMAFFKTYFLPLASDCKARAVHEANSGNTAAAKTYNLLVTQIWALLPGFCNSPTDLKTSFKALARTLGETLQAVKELRIDILSSLRQLIMKSKGKNDQEEELAKYAKNFLPILFNLYTTQPVGAEETGQRQSILATIKQYLNITNEELCRTMYDKAFERYSQATEEFLKDSCIDILQAMIPHQDKGRVGKIFTVCHGEITSNDHRKQKKSYRVLEQIFQTENCREFVSENLEKIKEMFLMALSKSSPSSQAYRIRCLIHIIQNLKEKQEDFVFSVVPEAILCIKATNEKARSGAYSLLVVIGEALQRWNDGDLDDVVRQYMQVVLAGLSGNPTLIHCSVLAITRIFFEYKDMFPDDLMKLLIDNVCLLVTSQSREVVGSSLSFLHVYITSSSVLKSTQHVEQIMKSVVKMTDDCKRHFRLKTRYLIDRMVRKFGFDLISSLVPKDDVQMHKRLKNIRKIQMRKKKEKEANAEVEEDSDDETAGQFKINSKPKTIDEILADSDSDGGMGNENVDDSNTKKRKRGKKTPQSFIAVDQENGEGANIIDFLDASASQNITTKAPSKRTVGGEESKAKKKESQFPVAPDGRLVIKDVSDDSEEEEEDEEARLNRKLKMDSDDTDDEGASFEKLVSTRKRKAGTSVASGKSRASTTASGPAMKYRAGGTGIHRPIKSKPTDYGAEYRAKKGKGDVKLKGKPDPYAYVPLQKNSLNKRKKAKFEGQFRSIIKATQKGAASGKKGRLVAKMKNMSV